VQSDRQEQRNSNAVNAAGKVEPMTGIALEQLPDDARTAWTRLRDELRAIAGDDLVAIWAYGSTIGADRPHRPADLDTHVVLQRRPDAQTARRIQQGSTAILDDRQEWDTWFITLDDARRAKRPPHVFLPDRWDESWAIHRAHWLAGRVVTIHGPDPAEIVLPPTWQELAADLHAELEHLERHVQAGDTDPYEAAYAVLNGSRILRSLESRDVVLSKREAGQWALEHLPDRWHATIRAALHAYDEQASAEEVELLAREMAPFVSIVRDGFR
jgi:Domain of unknown function (DUF4111)